MNDGNFYWTTDGEALKAKINLGDGTIPFEITRIVTSADTSGDFMNMPASDVIVAQTYVITKKEQIGPRASISAYLNNFGNAIGNFPPVEEGYNISRILFMANDPDKGEIVARGAQFPNPQFVPPTISGRGFQHIPTFNIIVANASEVIVNIDPSNAFLTMADLEAHDSNPSAHGNQFITINTQITDILNKLEALMGFTISGIVPTFPDLPPTAGIPEGTLYLVLSDMNQGGNSSVYEVLGGNWVFAGSWGINISYASETEAGIARFATAAEIAAGVANDLGVSVAQLRNASNPVFHGVTSTAPAARDKVVTLLGAQNFVPNLFGTRVSVFFGLDNTAAQPRLVFGNNAPMDILYDNWSPAPANLFRAGIIYDFVIVNFITPVCMLVGDYGAAIPPMWQNAPINTGVMTPGAVGSVMVARTANKCDLSINLSNVSPVGFGDVVICTLPARFRPVEDQQIMLLNRISFHTNPVTGRGVNDIVSMLLLASGNLIIRNLQDTPGVTVGGHILGQRSYVSQ